MNVLRFNLAKPIVLNEPIVACIGYFDGLHKGHQALINRTIDYAKDNNIKSCLITFNPDPNDVVKGFKHQHLQTFTSRLQMIAKYNLDYCIILEFTEEMSKLPHDLFYERILTYLNIKKLICGFDFRYGYKGLGNYYTLTSYQNSGFEVEMIDSINYLDDKISTSRIKKNLSLGNIELVNSMLGYRYFIEGIVSKGKRIGHLINYPTANIVVDNEVYIIKEGVYIVDVLLGDEYYKGMVNIGYNPTVSNDNSKTIEVHILDFNQDIYGKTLRIYFNKRIRDEIRFNSLDELSKQLKLDCEMVRNYYGK